MASSDIAKDHKPLPNHSEPEISLSEDSQSDLSTTPKRPKSTGRRHRKLERGTENNREEAKIAHCGDNNGSSRHVAQEGKDGVMQSEVTIPLQVSLASSNDFDRKRNAAFPHAHPLRRKQTLHLAQTIPRIPSPQLMAQRPVALLVASLGNPPPYQSTRHSAGHIVLNYLRSNLSLPPFTLKSKTYAGGHVSSGAEISRPEYTLWQSPSLMNVSGPGLLKAWRQFVSIQKGSSLDPITGLVILHDEMETEPGHVTVRRSGSGSAKGHNGIKSVQQSFNGAGEQKSLKDQVTRIGIGIGRPPGGSRESRDVSAYVLGQLTSRERDGLEKAAREVEGVLYHELARMGQV